MAETSSTAAAANFVIPPFLPHSVERIIHAFVTSRLDLNNSLLYGLPTYLLQKLQRIQNAAARIITLSPKQCHITPILQQLHWLLIPQRIIFKILLTVHKALNNKAPGYIKDMLVWKESCRDLRSNDQHLLVVPRARTSTYGDRCFSHSAPALWNDLPLNLRLIQDIELFKCQLKTNLFRKSYNLY